MMANEASDRHMVTDGWVCRSATIDNEMLPIYPFQSQEQDTCHSTPRAASAQHTAHLGIICANICQKS